MNKTACVSSLIVLFAVSPALVGQQPGGNSSSARFRNERQAERTNPAERAALLAVTNAGANVIVNDAGSVEVVELEGMRLSRFAAGSSARPAATEAAQDRPYAGHRLEPAICSPAHDTREPGAESRPVSPTSVWFISKGCGI